MVLPARRLTTILLLALEVRHVAAVYDACTTIGVSGGASEDGSTMVTHTSDCAQCDSRIIYIEPKDWPEGSQRPLYSVNLEYPREVTTRSVEYHPKPGQNWSKPVGHIPQVPHTYGYFEAVYGYQNEHGLSLGEATSSGWYPAAQFPNQTEGRHTLLWIRELTQLAMERCKTARCAADTMGHLAETYGFYGEDPGPQGAAEQLTLADGKELWMFEITSTPSGTGAFWAAARVPEGHVIVAANNLIIRELDCDDSENFRCSTDLPAKLKEAGRWNGEGKPDWLKSVGQDVRTFDYMPGLAPIPLYVTSRIWRIFDLVSPSRGFRLSNDPYSYPFSVQVESPVSLRRLMDFKRDHFEGSEIDLTVGPMAGPFGNPNRVEGGPGFKMTGAQFPRAISLHRTSYGTLGQSYPSEDGLNKLWFSSDTPASSIFVPFYAKAPSYALTYRSGHCSEYDSKSAWWVFNFVSNWMDLYYVLMKVDVTQKQTELSDMIDVEREIVESGVKQHLKEGKSPEVAHWMLGEFQTGIQNRVVDSWREFGKFLIMKYNDGYINDVKVGTSLGYPAWWLETFCADGDIRPKWARPAQHPPRIYNMFGPSPLDIPATVNMSAYKKDVCSGESWEHKKNAETESFYARPALATGGISIGSEKSVVAKAVELSVVPDTMTASGIFIFGAPYFGVFLVGWLAGTIQLGTRRAREDRDDESRYYIAAPSA